jgi:glycerophosphoryl diester phosphodiesterase
MKANKIFLLIFNLIFLYTSLTPVYSGEGTKRYYLVTKIGRSDFRSDKLRFFSEDKLLLLDKKNSLISYWGIAEKSYKVIDNISHPLDFDYASGSIYLLYGEPSLLQRYFVSLNNFADNKTDDNNPVRIDSTFNLNQIFKKPVSISIDRYNRYLVVADTGSINSITSENKMFSLKFLNYRPGEVVFEGYSRSVYSSEFTTKSLLKISVDGKTEPLISNFDSNNQFVVDTRGNVFILDKKNDFLAKFSPNKKLSILLEKICGVQSIAMHNYCDTIFYFSNKNNDIFRMEEIPVSKENIKNIITLKQGDDVYISNSILFITNGKSKKYYHPDGKKCNPADDLVKSFDRSTDSLLNVSKAAEAAIANFKKIDSKIDNDNLFYIGNNCWLVKEKSGKKDILSVVSENNLNYNKHKIAEGEYISNPYIKNTDECVIVNNAGELVSVRFDSGQRVIGRGLSDFKNILYSNDKFCYVINEKGELIKFDYKQGKTLIAKNISNKSKIIRSSENDIFLRDGNKIYKLETGMESILQFFETEKPAFCFHRGYSAKAPENSMSAFDLTLSKGGRIIEFDVQMTKDNELVIMHDESINRTSNGKGKIIDLNLNQLDTMDIGSWFSADFEGEKIPKFSNVLSRFNSKLFLDIELKGDGVSDIGLFCEKVISEIKKYNSINHVLITSFDRKILKKIRELDRNILEGLLIDNRDDAKNMDVFIDENKIDALVCNHLLLNKDLVGALKAKKKMVMVYTVNNKKDYERCKELDVDCIISNDPFCLTSK